MSEDNVVAGDFRTEEQWIGDVAHCTLGRLEELRGELANLAKQFAMLRGWIDNQIPALDSYQLEQYEQACLELGNPNGATAVVQGVVALTGRPKQPYHNHSGS